METTFIIPMKNLYAKIALYHKKGVKLEKDKQNPYFKSMYMSLDNIVNTITPVLNEVGLILTHNVSNYEWKSYVVSMLADPESSEALQSSFPIHGTDPQKVGSEISYGKRYNTSCLLNIVDSEDDDGNMSTDDIKNTPKTHEAPKNDTQYPKSKTLAEYIAEIKSEWDSNVIRALQDEAKKGRLSEKQIAWLDKEVEARLAVLKNSPF